MMTLGAAYHTRTHVYDNHRSKVMNSLINEIKGLELNKSQQWC